MQRISGTQSPQNKPGCHTRRRPKSKKAATCVLAWAAAFIIVCGFCHIYFCSFKRFFAHSRYLHTASGQRKRFLHPIAAVRKKDSHIRRRPKNKKAATCVLAWAAAFIIVCGFCHIYFCSFKRFFAHSRYLHTASGQRKRFLHPTVTAREKDSPTRRRPKSKKSRNSCIRRGLRLLS